MIRQFINAGMKILASLMLVTQMTACGVEDAFEDASPDTSDVVISGSVGDGPITGATITTYNAKGEELASVISDIYATYTSIIKFKGREYPLTMEVTGGIDLVTGTSPDFTLYSVSMRRSEKSVNINPFSTLIVKIARLMPGGVNAENINIAKGYVTDKLGFGLDLNLFEDPILTPVSDLNVANIVKASETMGEMIRRTRDVVTSTGSVVTGDDVMDAMAADMVDGFLDGAGAAGTSPSISAVANVVSGQVLVEALSNNLRVGGMIATGLIDQAIEITRINIDSSLLTGNVRITQGMLNQAQVAIAAARVVDSSALVTDISESLDGISADNLPADVVGDLPADTSESLDNAVILSSIASDEDAASINQVVHTDSTDSDTGDTGDTGTPNNVPIISGTPAGSVQANTGYVFQPSATDADGDALSYSISSKPGWAGFDTGSGRLSGTPDNGDAGTYGNIVISVSDGTAAASLPVFSIKVDAVNTAPVISGTPAGSVEANTGYVFQPSATDADGDALSYSINSKPGWVGFDTGSGRLSGTPDNGDAGTYGNIVISVSDGTDAASLPAFSIRVEAVIPPNTPPVINGTPVGLVEAGSGYVFQPSATDADGDALSFSISSKPGWAGFDTGSGRLSGTPDNGDAGTYGNIVISVSDGTAAASLPAFSIKVDAVNTAPIISGTPAGSVQANTGYVFQPSATDADGDALSYSISSKPGWAGFDTGSGRLSGTPDNGDAGTYGNIVISVSDGTDAASLPAFSIRVDALEDATRIDTGLVAYYPFTAGAGNVVSDRSGNGSPMDLVLSGAVSWSGSGNGVVFSGGRVGTTGAATKVINALRASNMSSFEVWVEPANVTQSGPSRMISVGGGTSLQNFMLGQERDEVEARLTDTGKNAKGQPYLTTVNGPLGTGLVHLVHTYDGAVERLYINGVPYSETLAIGGSYSNWDVTDLFSIGNEASMDRPYAGVIRLVAVYDRALGDAEVQQNFAAGAAVEDTAGSGDGGSAGSGDGGGTSDPANTAPVISGTPAGSVEAGSGYVFQPTASDADGNVLAFSIANKPGWASFSDTTGHLSGTPTNADVGTYDNILISVTDSLDMASLPAFSIRVDAMVVQTGNFTLSWTAPVTRADGTPLSLADIDGFRVYYGETAGSYPNSVEVTDGTAQTVTVTDVPVGDYRVVMTTYDVDGRESGYSAEAAKTAQ